MSTHSHPSRTLATAMPHTMFRSRGFTLIELMVAVVIIAILASVALPSYRGYSVRSNRTVAKTVLSQVAQQQESWFGDRKTYASRLTLLGYPADAMYIDSSGEVRSGATGNSTYRISLAAIGSGDLTRCSTNTATTASTRFSWVLVAEPLGAQTGSDTLCGTLCLYSTGQRGATIPTSSDVMLKQCWVR